MRRVVHEKYVVFLHPCLQTIGTKPIAHIDQFLPEMLGTAELAEEVHLDGSGKLVKVRHNQSDHRTEGNEGNSNTL